MSKDDVLLRKASLSERRAKLPDRERALLEKLLQGEPDAKDQVLPQDLEPSPISLAPAQLPDPPSHHAAPVLCQHRNRAVSSSLLVPMQMGHADKRPLFLVHPVSGDVWRYAELVRHLGPDRSFYGLQAQGLDGERPPHTRLETMASHYVELLRTVQAQGPFLLGGWSMGGIVAFEMAQQLQAQGQTVPLLALLDSHKPLGHQMEELDEAALLASFALDLGLPLRRLRLDWEHLEQFTRDEWLAYALEQAKRAHILSPDVEPTWLCRLFQVFTNNSHAAERYIPVAYAGPITLFRAGEQFGDSDKDLGWGELAAGGLTVQVVPGDHYTMVRAPHVKILAERLNHQLNTIQVRDGRDVASNTR